MTGNDPVTIRSIQHYLYCPHRWGLMEIDDAWAENLYVTKANMLHERVHDPENKYISRGKKVVTSLSVYNDLPEFNIYGKTDCVEFIPDNDGIFIEQFQGKYKLCVVEYKPTKPKNTNFNIDDLMQVFAQKICIDHIFGGDAEGVIYYADVKKRVKLPLTDNADEYVQTLKSILRDMRYYMTKGEIPGIRNDQKCSGCSMKDICMPSTKPKYNVRTIINDIERAAL